MLSEKGHGHQVLIFPVMRIFRHTTTYDHYPLQRSPRAGLFIQHRQLFINVETHTGRQQWIADIEHPEPLGTGGPASGR